MVRYILSKTRLDIFYIPDIKRSKLKYYIKSPFSIKKQLFKDFIELLTSLFEKDKIKRGGDHLFLVLRMQLD